MAELQASETYSQAGEDRIAAFALAHLGIRQPVYLDVGASHPTRLNNTYLFYRRGASGVCIEPNPGHCAAIRTTRPRDHCLQAGLGGRAAPALPFYCLEPDTLSTFSEAEARRMIAEEGARLAATVAIPVLSLADVHAEAGHPGAFDYASIDVEGAELEILQSIDFEARRPAVLCCETITYSARGQGAKRWDLLDFMRDREYLVFGDSFVNTVFADRRRWQARFGGLPRLDR